MPSRRWPVILIAAFALTGCKDRALEQRTEEIRALSNREDIIYRKEALERIEHQYWTLHDGAWLGKRQDGSIVRLESPQISLAPLPSRAFYRGWHLQMTVSSDDWRTYPPASHEGSFAVVYAITRESITSWDIRVAQGDITAPLRREDAAAVQ